MTIREQALPAARSILRTLAPLVAGHRLWEPGETLAIGISGGKDSLALGLLLLTGKELGLPPCRVVALHVPPPERCPCHSQARRLQNILSDWPVERFISLEAPFPTGTSPECSLCSRQRRRLLFETCLEHGFRTLAFAHHQDDLVQTYLLNLLFHGEPSGTMLPLRTYAEGRLRLIRPLLTTPEKRVIAFARRADLLPEPAQSGPLPHPAAAPEQAWQSQREVIRRFLHGLGRQRDQAKQNLARLASAEFDRPTEEPSPSGQIPEICR